MLLHGLHGLHGLLVKAAPTVATGVVGVAAYEALAKAPWRKATVTATAWGLRFAREAERTTKASAERARLAVADVLAEAVERIAEPDHCRRGDGILLSQRGD